MPLFKNWRKKAPQPEPNCERIAGAHGDILLHSCGTAFNLIIVACARYFHENHNFTQETSKTIKIPNWTTLFFYSPMHVRIATNIYRFMTGMYKPVDVYGPGQSTHQYILFSFFDSDFEPLNQLCRAAMFFSSNTQKQNKNADPDPFELYDIAYVVGGDIYSLSDFLNELYSQGKIYQKIHCILDRISFGVDKYTVPLYDLGRTPITIVEEGLGQWQILP
ncbi:hypothetical protein NX722_26210 [Endozoicomonas gorgoniicola]|uniref:Putative adhesin Stv domain-containing protein n=1 Tax=Endozoicomonas gorgoniicola TaxID=1234144 RepID=A0ABT3N369_9GAMM|nr:hypothetical protein [Endozoicomonas gorgoniicola]MCW7556059.1 hypothetical protein [Endozoicomonas gorgoniicola]